ncbi:MAG: C40 family peptidase [Deltaproteobacteria bacterium]|nr:C40 family peptidase [Deltaproteobacteria bacterium]
MRVDPTGNNFFPDLETLAAMTEAAANQRCTGEPETPLPPRHWAFLSDAINDAIRVETGRLRPATKALAEKALDRLRDGSVDDKSLLLILGGLHCLGRSKENMGLDCSGFVKHLAKEAGAPLESSITAPGKNGCTQMKGSFPPVAPEDARTGDLIFFNNKADPQKTASHVGIVIVAHDGEKLFLHMTNHGVDINKMSDIASNETRATWGGQLCGFARNPAVCPA